MSITVRSSRLPERDVMSRPTPASAVRGVLSRLVVWRPASRTGAARDAGMSTAEYAIGTVAACAFAVLLYKVITSTQVFDLLSGVVTRALHVPF